MDKVKYHELITILFHSFKIEINDEMIMSWHWTLKNYSLEAIEFAVRNIIHSSYQKHEVTVSAVVYHAKHYIQIEKEMQLEENSNVHKLSK